MFKSLTESRISDVLIKIHPLRREVIVEFAKEPSEELEQNLRDLEGCNVFPSGTREYRIQSDFYKLEELAEILIQGFLEEGFVSKRMKFAPDSNGLWEADFVDNF